MKKYLLINLLFLFVAIHSFATTTYRVGASEIYTKIADAYNACSGSDNYIIEIQNDYNFSDEISSGLNTINLTARPLQSASYNVIIRPASGVSLSFLGASSTSVFTLDGANWVTIDGRAGGVGTTSALTLINTSQRIMIFKNGASNNTIKYCETRGDSPAGMFFFTTSTTTGNNYNTIDNCYIKCYSITSTYLVYSKGTSGKSNTGNIISNCNLVDFKQAAIWLDDNTTNWSILNNHIYQTSSFTPSLQDVRIIYVKTGNGYTITGNFIGGQASNCGGTAFKVNNSSKNFAVIYFDTPTTSGVVNTINKNTIANLNVANNSVNVSIEPFSIIRTSGKGNYIIGALGNGNTIGSTTGVGSITFKYTGNRAYTSAFSVINSKTIGSTTISYNAIGAITDSTEASTSTAFYRFSLISLQTKAPVTVDNNIIGNETADNIKVTSGIEYMSGIIDYTNLDSTTNHVFSNNILQNFTVMDVAFGTTTKCRGINISDIGKQNLTINNNTVKKINLNASMLDGDSDYRNYTSMSGIYINGNGTNSTWGIYDNKISDLGGTYNGGSLIHYNGILVTTPSNPKISLYRNKIRNLTNSSTNSDSELTGIFYSGRNDTINIYNNIVLLSDATSNSKGLYGITIDSSSFFGVIAMYHNTIKLSGTFTSGTGSSAALNMITNPSANYIVKNNIFQNNVSGGFGSHYAQLWSSTYGVTSNIRNNYNQGTTSTKLVSWGGVNQTISAWRTSIGDSSDTELTGSITISSTTGETSSDAIVGSKGTPISSILTDYDLNPRSATDPWIGAFELITPLSFNLEKINAKCQKSKTSNSQYGGTVTWTTLNETNNDYYTIEKSMDGFVWEVKDTIDGAGTIYQPTDYYFHDNFINPTPENETVVYYRVNQTDFDGVVHSFDILSCKCEASEKIKIHPIPSQESIVINFGDQNNVPNTFQIIDMYGHIIEDINVVGDKANYTSYKLDISRYSSGRYLIKINDWKMKEDGIFIKE